MREVVVYCKLQFVGFHRWKDAPHQVKYLQSWHRHVFHVICGRKVTELNRQIEFITLKNNITAFVREKYENQYFEDSCEMIANEIMGIFDLSFCSVSEDDENGAIVHEFKERI
jgi:hypothetical protein